MVAVRSTKSVMGRVNKDLRPKGAVGVYILNKENELLLSLRSSKHGSGAWSPPGGHIEYGESFALASAREAFEEVGIKVLKTELLGVTNDIYREGKKHYVTLHLKATLYKGRPSIKEPDKATDMRWFPLNKLPKNLFLSNKHFFAGNPLCLCGSGKKYKKCHGE